MDALNARYRGRLMPASHDGSGDPAIVGLTELVESELERAALSEPELLELADPGRVWLLWFAIGATDAVCHLLGRQTEARRNTVFRQVVHAIYNGNRTRSRYDPVQADRRQIDLFESAGAEAVAACLRGDKKLGYYVEALRVSRLREL